METNNDEFLKKVMRCFAYQMSSKLSEGLKPDRFRILEIHHWIFYLLVSVPIIFGKWVDKYNSQELINTSIIEAKEILENKEFRNEFYTNIKLKSEGKILQHSDFIQMSIDTIRLPEISEKYLIPEQPMLYACLISQIEEIGLNDLC